MRRCLFSFALLPLISFGEEPPAKSGDKQFTMMKGQGVPVCEAYLDLLNQTQFKVTPFCARPENGPAPFIPLERRDLGVDEIGQVFTYVYEFMRFDDQHHVEKFFHPNMDPNKSYWSTVAMTPEEITPLRVLNKMLVWTYNTPVDIGNDGRPVRLLMWQGYGAWGNDAFCGVYYGDEISYVPQRAFVLGADGKSIDEAQTRAIFGMPTKTSSYARDTGRELLNYPGPDLPAGATPFQALADSIGVFGYDGRYYMQTENMPRPRGARLPPVKVFLREHGHTTQVCAFRPQAIPTEFQGLIDNRSFP